MAGYFQLKKTADGNYGFSLKAGNHEVILTSQTYKSRQSALEGIDSVRRNSQVAERFERRVAKDGSPYFVLTATNGQSVGRSEMYSGAAAMENGIRSVMANGSTPTLKEIEPDAGGSGPASS